MPLHTVNAKTYVITLPPTKPGDVEHELARIVCSEESKQLLLKFSGFSNKQLLQGLPLTPYAAAFIGDALKEAADIANKAWNS
jgi:hypothetical protein